MKIGKTALLIMRKYLVKHDGKIIRSWPSMDGFSSVRDIDVMGDGNFYHGMDVFYAPEEKANGKTIIHIHGGAYVYGDRKNIYGYAHVFLEKGYNVVLLDYEHNDETHGFQDQIREVSVALAYLSAHAKELRLDPNAFYLSGDSAGGHFALILGEMADDEALAKRLGHDLGGIRFQGLALSCPVYDFERNATSRSLSKSGRRFMYGPRFDDMELVRAYSPRVNIDSLKTPFVVCSCSNDFIRQESCDLAADAMAKGMRHRFFYLDGCRREVSHVFNVMDIALPESVQANATIDEFFRGA